MKKFYLPIIITLIIHFTVFAQEGWKLIYTFPQRISSAFFVDSLNGFAYPASSGLYKTTDGGINWNVLNIPKLNSNISKIIFYANNTLLGVGNGGTIIQSTDSGNSWDIKNIGSSDNLVSICSTIDDKIFINSESKKIYRSTDKGNTWNTYSLDTMYYYPISLSFSNSLDGFGVSYYETSIKTTDGGNTWFKIPPIIPGVSMFAVKFVNQNVGYVIGGDKIAKTTDSGNSWTIKYSAGGSQLNDITTYGDSVIWVVGQDKILKTTDAGESWHLQTFSPYHYLTTTFCINTMVCFAVGDHGTLYKATNGGSVTSIEKPEKEISNYSIQQNYPNPFNPSTIIDYQIPKSGLVTLKVYDILGREIATLVNEEKPAGNYKIIFNGTNLTSGIYFYKIQAGNFSSIKKMILIR